MTNVTCREQIVTFYLVLFTKDTESFLKIGLTSATIKSRFKGSRYSSYSYTILKSLKMSAHKAVAMEQIILLEYNHYSYILDDINFKGKTELFTFNFKDRLIKIIETLELTLNEQGVHT